MTSLTQRLQRIQPALDRKARPPITIPFGDYLPDLPEFANPGALTMTGVIPRPSSYAPLQDLTAQTNAIDDICRGAASFKDDSGNTFVYAGDDTKLYEAVGSTFTDESKGGGYSLTSDDRWEFTQFDTLVIATNGTDPVQSLTIGGGGAGMFADHITSTNVPKGRHLATLLNFLVLGNTNDATDGVKTNRVWWSAIGDSTDFDPDATTQSDFEDLKDGGAVTAVIGAYDYGAIFQERLITRMVYVGSPLVFEFQPVHRLRGTVFPGSIATLGRNVFYLSEEGFFVFNGLESQPIGEGKVDRTVLGQFSVNDRRQMSAAIDAENKLYAIGFPGEGSTGGRPNKIFFYYWPDGKWTEAPKDHEFLLRTATQGYTLDGLDTVGTDIDDSNVFDQSFDAAKWQGGILRFGAFDTDNKLAFFVGSNLAATLDTGEVQLTPGKRSLVTKIRPLVDGGTLTAQIGGRALLTAANSFDAAAAINDTGDCSVRNSNRYHRMRVNIAAGGTWSHAQGVVVTSRPQGER